MTTAVGGNCGFTVSPLCPEAADYLMRMLAKVEGMPLEALQAGVPWDWQSTAEYLDRLDGQLSLNAGFSVGHSAMRQVVMGDAARERHASAGELQQMVDLLRAGLTAGALGFTSTWSTTHNDADAKPVPSRWASGEELIALASVCREFPGTSLEFLPSPGPWDAETERVMVAMTVAASRPLNWNLISATEQSMPEWEQKLALSDRARQAGGKIVGLVLPRSPAARFSFYSGMVLDALPGWAPILGLPYDRRLEALKDPECRLRLDEGARQPGPRQHFSDWGGMRIVETFSEETKRYVGALVGDIARDNSKSAFDALLDIVVADQLKTSFSFARVDDTDADWKARASIWRLAHCCRRLGCGGPPGHADDVQLRHGSFVARRSEAQPPDIGGGGEATHWGTGRSLWFGPKGSDSRGISRRCRRLRPGDSGVWCGHDSVRSAGRRRPVVRRRQWGRSGARERSSNRRDRRNDRTDSWNSLAFWTRYRHA